MMTFDEALPSLVRICETTSGFETIERACVVRDLRGRLRLVLKASTDTSALDRPELGRTLKSVLGDYFSEPIWSVQAELSSDERRLATKLLELSNAWDARYMDTSTGEERIPVPGRWRKIERHISKHAWLTAEGPGAPWPLDSHSPAVVTFYSFKGGVGRTTALVSCAWQLAKLQKKVAVVDLDLEAPGLGPLLGVRTERGVLDFLIDFLSVESRDVSQLHAPANALGVDQEWISVFAAGTLGLSYLEKLARLDFTEDLPSRDETPMQRALRALLHGIRAAIRPDYIFIDSRAGLHDLAGLSLHGLAHVDVVLGRADNQAYDGLELTLGQLGRIQKDNLRCVLVHTFAPAGRGSALELEERTSFRRRAYEIFSHHIYDPYFEDIEIPAEDAVRSPHDPIVLHVDDALRSMSSPAALEPYLFSEDYRQLCERLVELSQPEELYEP